MVGLTGLSVDDLQEPLDFVTDTEAVPLGCILGTAHVAIIVSEPEPSLPSQLFVPVLHLDTVAYVFPSRWTGLNRWCARALLALRLRLYPCWITGFVAGYAVVPTWCVFDHAEAVHVTYVTETLNSGFKADRSGTILLSTSRCYSKTK